MVHDIVSYEEVTMNNLKVINEDAKAREIKSGSDS